MIFKTFVRAGLGLICGVSLVATMVLPAFAQTCDGKRLKRSQTRIVGGWQAKIKHWPGQAVFRLRDSNSGEADYFCGGSAISPNFILTAAHCLEAIEEQGAGHYGDAKGRVLEIQLGTDNLKSGSQPFIRQISKIIRHKKYQAGNAINNGFDIALVKIRTPWTGPFATLSMDGKYDPSNAGNRVMVAGFGLTKGESGLKKYERAGGGDFYSGSDILLQTAVPTVDTEQCAARYSSSKIAAGQLCAGLDHGGKDSCNGDSGGPLVAHTKNGCPYQIGVVSWGPPDCGAKKYYGVYTRISHFSDWIKTHVPDAKAVRTRSTGANKTSAVLNQQDVNLAIKQIENLLGSGRDKVQLQLRLFNEDAPIPNHKVSADQHYILNIASQVDGQLILVDIDEDGKVTQIFPNKFTLSRGVGKIASGTQIQVPGDEYGFDAFRAEIPAGKANAASVKGRLLAFVVPDNFKIDQMVGAQARSLRGFVPEKIPTSYLMNLVNQISSLWSVRSTSSGGNKWAYSVINYEIINN